MKTSRAAGVLARASATWFGCGYAPAAPGTAGSLGALLPAVLAWREFHIQGWEVAVAGAALLLPAVWAADVTARDLGQDDPGLVVIDEVVGQWITFAGALRFNWRSLLAAFVLFRAFDIWKPFPIRRLERLPGGWGIVADDALAGIYASLVLFLLGWFNFY